MHMSTPSRRWALIAGLLLFSATYAAARPAEPPPLIGSGMGQVTFLRFSPSGNELVRICQFGGVERIATDKYDRLRTFEIGMRMVAFSPDGKRLATAEGTDGARVWDAMLPGKDLGIPKDPGIPWHEILVVDTPIKVLETQSSEGVNSVETRADMKRVLWADFSPDGKRLLTLQPNGHVKVWSAATWSLESDLKVTEAELWTAMFAPDGKTILAGDADGVIHEWDLEQKKEARTMKAPGGVTQIVFAPDASSIATAHVGAAEEGSKERSSPWAGSSVVFWDRDRKLVETKKGAWSVAISKDGTRLAIGGKNVELLDPASRKSVRAVELAEITMRESNPALAPDDEEMKKVADQKIPVSVTSLAFSPDGATLAAGCFDGTIRLIKVAP